jgi:hypothetical protein
VGAVTTTLFNDFFTTDADIGLQYDVPVGGVSTLDLLVFSEASTTGAGQSGQNLAQVTFGGTLGDPAAIPLPGTLVLVITGLATMLMRRRKQ